MKIMKSTLLQQKQFRNFFISDIISGFGVGLTTVGANWYVLEQTNSDSIVGTFLVINVLAGFLISPIAGYVTDKFTRRNVIIGTFLIRAVPLGIIAACLVLFKFNLLEMYALAMVTGVGWVAYMAASRSYIQSIVPQKLLGSTNSFIEVSLQVGMFLAGGLSGFLLKYTGFIAILIINIILFIVAIILMFNSPVDQLEKTGAKDNASHGSVIKYLRKHRLVLFLGILSVLPLLVTQLFNVSMPGYISHILHASSVSYGTTDMFYGIGVLVAGLITAKLLEKMTKKFINRFFLNC
ncbi:MFS transporter [Lactobacillus sanfranciscensis]|nr:MFS transporter [Fructilactobacillus sanfranciscensis]NDR96995.1 MFS transporter [Fructilactobacillus sanfranciscensis]NDS04892.1 MFS transporter [Fructilactobacillus sanfranciscensis]